MGSDNLQLIAFYKYANPLGSIGIIPQCLIFLVVYETISKSSFCIANKT
jgi:hypothetical protein